MLNRVGLGAVLIWLLLAACSSDGGSGDGAAATCEEACQHLSSQCASEYMNANCVAECQGGDVSSKLLGCCAKTPWPAGKCELEGLGEVGTEDCDDEELGCE